MNTTVIWLSSLTLQPGKLQLDGNVRPHLPFRYKFTTTTCWRDNRDEASTVSLVHRSRGAVAPWAHLRHEVGEGRGKVASSLNLLGSWAPRRPWRRLVPKAFGAVKFCFQRGSARMRPEHPRTGQKAFLFPQFS